jgi:hypothetical protein
MKSNLTNQLEAYYPPASNILKKSVLINSDNSNEASNKKTSLSFVQEEDDI